MWNTHIGDYGICVEFKLDCDVKCIISYEKLKTNYIQDNIGKVWTLTWDRVRKANIYYQLWEPLYGPSWSLNVICFIEPPIFLVHGVIGRLGLYTFEKSNMGLKMLYRGYFMMFLVQIIKTQSYTKSTQSSYAWFQLEHSHVEWIIMAWFELI